jgi:hypothetical protein
MNGTAMLLRLYSLPYHGVLFFLVLDGIETLPSHKRKSSFLGRID